MASQLSALGSGNIASQNEDEFLPGEITPAEGPNDPVKAAQEALQQQKKQQNTEKIAKLKPNFTNLDELFPQVVSALAI